MRNPSHKLKEQNLSTIIIRTAPNGVGLSDHIKVHYQFHTMVMQTHQQILYLRDISKCAFDISRCLRSYTKPLSIHNDTEITTPRIPINHDYSRRSIHSD